MKTDPRIDAYIARQADFARPILDHLRDDRPRGLPGLRGDAEMELPSFMYKGKILAGFAAFKAHATFGFWNGSQMLETRTRQDERDGPVRPADLARRPAAARDLDRADQEGDGADRRRA